MTSIALPIALPTRVPRASIDLTEWIAQPGKLPCWVVCNRADDDAGRDPHSHELEWARPCERCGTASYVKADFVTGGFRVVDWWCFRAAGGRKVMLHPEMWEEIEAAGYAELALEALLEMHAWLAEPDVRAAHAAVIPSGWQRFANAIIAPRPPKLREGAR